MASIEIQNLYKIFGERPQEALALLEQGRTKDEVQAETGHVVGVNNANLQVRSGHMFVIMGLSGSGKSTLLRCINRLVEPTRGSIVIESGGESLDVTSVTRKELRRVRKQKVSMIFQHFALFPFRTVLSNVTFGLEIQGVPKAARERKGMEVLEMVGLAAWAESRPSQLSGGMQQRVGLARALASEAEILLMDEPFSALDPLIRVNMQNELINLQKTMKRTILFISHDLDEALKLGNRIAIMESGRIIQVGTPEQIIVNPRTEYVADFVEHADATGVLRAETIARDIAIGGDPPDIEGYDKKNMPGPLYAQAGDIVLSVHEDGRPLAGLAGDQQYRIRLCGRDHQTAEHDQEILAVPQDMTIRDILMERLENPRHPVLVLSEEGKLSGVITDRELLKGILEKGRTNGNDNGRDLEVQG